MRVSLVRRHTLLFFGLFCLLGNALARPARNPSDAEIGAAGAGPGDSARQKSLNAGSPVILGTEVTSAGHLMRARGYLGDDRIIINDPAWDYYQAAWTCSPFSGGADSDRYFNGGGERVFYDWDALSVR